MPKCCCPMLRCSLDKPLRSFFTAYSKYAYSHWAFLALSSVICTVILSGGLYWIEQLNITDSDYVCTPTNAPVYEEQKIVNRLWPPNSSRFQADRSTQFDHYAWIILEAKQPCIDATQQCNLLDDKYLKSLLAIDDYIYHNVTTSNGNTYQDLCLNFNGKCPRFNEILRFLLLLTKRNASIMATFPTVTVHGVDIYLGYSLGGVTKNDGNIISATAARMTYFLRDDTKEVGEDSMDWETKMEQVIDSDDTWLPNASLFKRGIFHSRSVDQGVHKNLLSAIPVLPLTVTVLLSFSIPFMMVLKEKENIANLAQPRALLDLISIDWVRSKPLLAPVGLLTAGMGIGSGMGILMWFGFEFPDASIVTPFLVLSIGVDDMFLLANAWQISDPSLSVQLRLSQCLSEAAVAITITSITDALSFFIGCLSTIPAVRFFCIHAGMCITFNYIYQITFFVSILVYLGKLEHDKRLCFLPCIQLKSQEKLGSAKSSNKNLPLPDLISIETIGSKPVWVEPVTPSNDIQQNGRESKLSKKNEDKKDQNANILEHKISQRNFGRAGYLYGSILLHPISKIICVSLYCGFIGLSVIGCLRMNEGLEYEDLLMPENKFLNYLKAEQELFNIGPQAVVVVGRCPNLLVPENRQAMYDMVRDFESNEFVLDGETHFWMLAYEKYTKYVLESTTNEHTVNMTDSWNTDWTAGIKIFLLLYNTSWFEDIVWKDPSQTTDLSTIKAFRFRISLTKINTPQLWKMSVKQIRDIAEKYQEFDVTTYGGIFWKTADQFMAVLPNTLLTTGIAMICMVVVAVLLIPNPICAFWIGITVLSIDIGVVGFMSLWGINLDYIAMITIIMSIGFSVDFAAHITYGYVCAEYEVQPTNDHSTLSHSNQKMILSLQKTGFPLFKAAASTVLGVATLYFTGSNMLMIFMKTVLLVISIGCLHALVFLPVVLSTCMPIIERVLNLCSCKNSNAVSHDVVAAANESTTKV